MQNESAKNDIQRFLSFAERSSGQLRKKVLSLGYSAFTAESMVNWGKEFGLINDSRFCALFISSRTMGKARLRMELVKKLVPETVINQALSQVSETESIIELVKQISSRYSGIENKTTARRRAIGWLSRRGFSSEVIHTVLRQAL